MIKYNGFNGIIILLLFLFILYFLSIKEKFNNKKRFLLFSSVGKREKSGIPFWKKSQNRNFDIVLYYYDYSKPKICEDYCINYRGTKFSNFHTAS